MMLQPISLAQFKTIYKSNTGIFLDLRHQDEFIKNHIPNTVFIGIDGPFDKWIQLIVPNKDSKLALILPKNREIECYKKFQELGYNNLIGHLDGGIDSWVLKYKTNNIKSISPEKFIKKRTLNNLLSVDVRKESEYYNSNISKTKLLPLTINNTFIDSFIPDNEYHLFCGGGYRSVIAISFLKQNGVHNLINIEKGFRGIKEVLSQK